MGGSGTWDLTGIWKDANPPEKPPGHNVTHWTTIEQDDTFVFFLRLWGLSLRSLEGIPLAIRGGRSIFYSPRIHEVLMRLESLSQWDWRSWITQGLLANGIQSRASLCFYVSWIIEVQVWIAEIKRHPAEGRGLLTIERMIVFPLSRKWNWSWGKYQCRVPPPQQNNPQLVEKNWQGLTWHLITSDDDPWHQCLGNTGGEEKRSRQPGKFEVKESRIILFIKGSLEACFHLLPL